MFSLLFCKWMTNLFQCLRSFAIPYPQEIVTLHLNGHAEWAGLCGEIHEKDNRHTGSVEQFFSFIVETLIWSVDPFRLPTAAEENRGK